MTAVQMGQESYRRQRGWLSLAQAEEERKGDDDSDDTGESGVQLHRVADPRTVIAQRGIRYQQCGGGRRVIRRQRGGA